jgi:gamma-glutamylcyclotransferase (GGCT)/AIG2-like uncharacterized protein YtfP
MMGYKMVLDRLFVYGTLRRGTGHEMSRFLALHADLLGTGTFQGQLYDLGRYPAVVSSEDAADLVKGDVYLLRDAESTIRALDEYEDCHGVESNHGLFRRRRATICMNRNVKTEAWIYIYNCPVPSPLRVLSGDYIEV